MITLDMVELLYPDIIRDNIIEDSFTLTPLQPGKMGKTYTFKPGVLAYIYIYINDYGSGIGKYIKVLAQKFKGEQKISKPTVRGSPYGMYVARAFASRGVNPGLVEYDPDEGVYAIQCEFRGYNLIINSEYKIMIQYPSETDIKNQADMANYGKPVYIEAYIATKEIDIGKLRDLVERVYILER